MGSQKTRKKKWKRVTLKHGVPLGVLNFKDKIKRELRSLLVYNFKCNGCNAEYINKTKRHKRTRTSEHIGVSPLTGKFVKNNSQTSAVHDHMLFCTTVVCPEDFSILVKISCSFKLEIRESTLVKLLKPTLNKIISSVPLYIFWYRPCNYTLFIENRRSNLIIFLFFSLIRSIEMLCKRITLSCDEAYWTLQM